MLSYQHGYHAGNFADVVKHLVLERLISYLTLKDAPVFYLETHAGKGLYDLTNAQAQKTKEYQQGIELLWGAKKKLPSLFQNYLQLIESFNATEKLLHYPGSPLIAAKLLRTQDRLTVCELHPQEFDALMKTPRLHQNMHKNHQDGLESLKALLPPREKRGLVFIDPSFEIKDDYKTIPKDIEAAYKRFSTGVYCLWYPILNPRLTEKLFRNLDAIHATKTLRLEFHLSNTPMQGMYGTGLWIINPPYTLAKEMKIVFNTLKDYFNPGQSSYLIQES